MKKGYAEVYWAMSQRMLDTMDYAREVIRIMEHYRYACGGMLGKSYASSVLKNELDLLTAKVNNPFGLYNMIDKQAHSKLVSDLMESFYTEGKA